MRKVLRSWKVWVGVLVVMGCGEGLGGILISNQQEVEIGQQVDQEIEQQFRIVDSADPVALWAVQLVTPLEDGSTFRRDPAEFNGYKVEVIADNELINAFAGPGGFTYISTGLILQSSTCAEVAGVMGHELAHVTERHSVKKIEGQFAATELANIFLGTGLASQTAQLVYQFLASTEFSQDDENEADRYGLQIARNAGYNPYGLVDFFEKLLALEQQAGVTVPEFLSSHPATADRVRNVGELIQELYPDIERGKSLSYDCVNTNLQLDEVKQRILNGQVAVRPGTGTNPNPDGP